MSNNEKYRFASNEITVTDYQLGLCVQTLAFQNNVATQI